MNAQDFVVFAFQVAIMLACALAFGHVMRLLHQPAILGEMLGGIVLGPTILGMIAPEWHAWLFHSSPAATMVRAGAVNLGMLLFLLIVGLEIDLRELRQHGLRALAIGAFGSLVPLFAGVAAVYLFPDVWGEQSTVDRFRYALLIGVALANTANPVLARILMELDLLNKPIGATIMSATVVDDLIAWSLLAVIMVDDSAIGVATTSTLIAGAWGMCLVLGFMAGLLVLGRMIGTPALRWARRALPWPTGFIGMVTIFALLAAAAAERLGLHAFLGTFLLGIALAPTAEERHEAYGVIHQFVLSFFAPIYFVSMGLSANFATDFDLPLVAIVLLLACVTKMGSVYVAGRFSGLPARTALAVSCGMNARGAIGIILASIAREQGVIDAPTYVALVVMAIATSMLAGPLMKRLIGTKEAVSDQLSARGDGEQVVNSLPPADR